MKNFTKSDLRTGDIIVTKEEGNAILIGNSFKRFEQLNDNFALINMHSYNDDLKSIFSQFDIEKVYRITDGYNSLEELIEKLPEDKVELVWEREIEIDWSKVPAFTRVLVRDSENTQWHKRYFIGYDDSDRFPYIVTACGEFSYDADDCGCNYKQIKIYDKNDIKTEWYK